MDDLNINCIIPGEETDGKISVFEEIIVPSSSPPLHTYKNQNEIFQVISGHVQFGLEGERIDVPSSGSFAIMPGKQHSFINKSEEKSIIYFELLPSGKSAQLFERFVTRKFEDLALFFKEHCLELLGPPIK